MKKVRFESPCKPITFLKMSDYDCQSPRPFLQRTVDPKILDYPEDNAKFVVYNPDPLHRFETSDSVPYPTVNKLYCTEVSEDAKYKPSNELELSMLDFNNHVPRKSIAPLQIRNYNIINVKPVNGPTNRQEQPPIDKDVAVTKFPNTLAKDDFFIRRDNMDKFWKRDFKVLQNQFNKLSLDKENNPLEQKAQMMKTHVEIPINPSQTLPSNTKYNLPDPIGNRSCLCHHCVPVNKHELPVFTAANCQTGINNLGYHKPEIPGPHPEVNNTPQQPSHHCPCMAPPPPKCHCNCEEVATVSSKKIPEPINDTSDKKSWKLERIKKINSANMEVERQTNLSQEKREPTVADLFEIIKMQNEQLQKLQEKVDTFISGSQHGIQSTQPCRPDHITQQVIETVSSKPQMSIGVMTSFEMVRTSTIINKEVVTQTTENAQVQCNRSQISIKEVISRTQPINQNFLEGISKTNSCSNITVGVTEQQTQPCQTVQEEKTLNEYSLYNVQVDNPITPLISPDQSLYLDVRDYSDSDSTSSEQSNVGWTYYNKVMTHVNGMLENSDMPSSASALFRNMRQQCVQMQIDKTNVSVAKRVKFGDDPLGIHQPHIYGGSTDTSLKMNELAAKYLNTRPAAPLVQYSKPTGTPVEMSFATRNYMERHKIIQGLPSTSRSPTTGNIPNFLDITALKNKPKLL